jgi:hypothetical protein
MAVATQGRAPDAGEEEGITIYDYFVFSFAILFLAIVGQLNIIILYSLFFFE